MKNNSLKNAQPGCQKRSIFVLLMKNLESDYTGVPQAGVYTESFKGDETFTLMMVKKLFF